MGKEQLALQEKASRNGITSKTKVAVAQRSNLAASASIAEVDRIEAEKSDLNKKDNRNIGMFSASGARAREDIPAKPEEKKEATKPVFTSSKKKTLTGGDQVEAIQSSKQNYDFSSF